MAKLPITFFDDLVRCETGLYNGVDDVMRSRHNLTAAQFEILRYLAEHPGARVADIAATFVIGVGATSKGIDRYEHQGWVRRQRDPQDRRSSLLTLTEAGATLVADAEPTFVDCVERLIGNAIDRLDWRASPKRSPTCAGHSSASGSASPPADQWAGELQQRFSKQHARCSSETVLFTTEFDGGNRYRCSSWLTRVAAPQRPYGWVERWKLDGTPTA